MAVTAQPVTSPNGQPLVAAQHISKTYGEEKSQVLVLKDVNLEIRPGEFIALLGPSGSGKSTLLRILAGLLPPSSGQVMVHGQPLRGTNPSVAMVFQSFALLPWLTVLDNVELGLLPQAFSPDDRRRRAKAAIELIGLHGFENAYPREISGGMKQRVGFARALVVEPELLMLDEPFSALDVLVADTLRRELADLWQGHKIPTRAILMVTHNIDEAVRLADRLVVFHTDPGGIRVECAGLPVDQREEKDPAHIQLVDSIYQIMTNPKEDAEQLLAGARPAEGVVSPREGHLPAATISGLTGFLHRLLALGGREDLHDLARDLRMGADHLLPLVDAANLLDLVDLAQGDVVLTAEGRRFAEASPAARRKLFRQQALANVELLGQIAKQLEAAPDHRLKDDRLLALLEQSFSPVEARRKLQTAINWGRYAGLFTYANGTFRLAPAPT
ncbi:MAG TPA: nitrate/sulfonate/bicarbonate ABC transporter ATP-binding protein [Candidatus Limnocylindria bacterium]|nr:nitrate/sulfonate/bicarbonate ABC transporter ATP-binding protein [Candidatus Limnocylindria bacterium]